MSRHLASLPSSPLSATPSSRRALSRRSLLTLATALAAAALGAGCASKPEVRHDRDQLADFSAYKTFAFQETHVPASGAPAAPGMLGTPYTTLHEARLRQAAVRELERQGLTQVVQGADLRVHVALKVVQRQELHTSPGTRSVGFGYRGWSTTRLDTVDVRQGTLVVDLVDVRRNALVWRGVAEGTVEDADAQNPGAAIERAMTDVFAGFKR
jgi:hypothetical protein